MLGLEVICFPFLTFVISVGTWCIEFNLCGFKLQSDLTLQYYKQTN